MRLQLRLVLKLRIYRALGGGRSVHTFLPCRLGFFGERAELAAGHGGLVCESVGGVAVLSGFLIDAARLLAQLAHRAELTEQVVGALA